MPKTPKSLSKSDVANLRDETIKRMLATPPLKHADEKHPRKKPLKPHGTAEEQKVTNAESESKVGGRGRASATLKRKKGP